MASEPDSRTRQDDMVNLADNQPQSGHVQGLGSTMSDLISESIYSSIRGEAGKTNSADNQSIPEPEPMQQDQSNHTPQATETPSVASKTLATLNEQIQSKRIRSNSRFMVAVYVSHGV